MQPHIAAYAATERAVQYFVDGGPLFSTLAADAFSAMARVLSAQGRRDDAIGRLEHALTLLTSDDDYARTVRCRVLDDLGLAYQGSGDRAEARRRFDEALQARRGSAPEFEVAQSLINLARLEVADDNLGRASEYADEASTLLGESPPSGTHANANVLLAQIRLRQGRPEDGIRPAERALALNRQLGNRRGEAISLLVLGQCCREAGQVDEARRHALACVKINRSTGDREGERKGQWLLDNLPE